MSEWSRDEMTIRTPDQRLRVFVSSTLGELSEERQAVARAIAALRLTPVMFELGARPHPPQEVYRAYIAQSDVFIGLYWQRYGWVGPGLEISGLEDELERSRALPRLLYIKAPAPDREPRLTEMLARVKDEAANSYRTFQTPRELSRLVRDDLATLLSERFTMVTSIADRVPRSPPVGARGPRPLPVCTTPLVGREEAVDEVTGLLGQAGGRLLTLTGPGGIGKTRLALAAAERLRDSYRAGVVFVPLVGVTRSERALVDIGRAVGADLAGAGASLEALVDQFGDEPWLLVLDNLEQVVGAAGELGEVLARCPALAILATSRTVLGLRAEREYPVPPLPLPVDPTTGRMEELAASPAVALFVDRARALHPGFVLTDENVRAVVEICRRLEGVPLAIELAAARTRLLEPDVLLGRLTTSLDALGTGMVDLPERQRTLRATVEWSVGLLSDAERSLLEIMTVFLDGWTVEAAAHVAGLGQDRALDLTEALHRHSLIQLDQTGLGLRTRMLETVREFVAERMAERPDADEVRRRHAGYYRAMIERADLPLRSTGQREWLERLEAEVGNLAAAVRWCLAHEPAPLPHLFRVLWPFWTIQDSKGELRSWVDQLLPAADSLDPQVQAELAWTAAVAAIDVGDDAATLAARERLALLLASVRDPYLHAVCLLVLGWTGPIAGDLDDALRHASASLARLRDIDEPFWTGISTFTVGFMEVATGRYDNAFRHAREVQELAARFDNDWLTAGSRVLLGTLAVIQGRLDEAREPLDEGLALGLAVRSTHHVSLCLNGLARLAAREGDMTRAALLTGAAESLRRRVGMRPWPMLRLMEHDQRAEICDALGTDLFDEAFAAGARLSYREAVAAGREVSRAVSTGRG